MIHRKLIPPLILLALASAAFADPLIFTGHGGTTGPPFPTDSIALQGRSTDGTPLQAFYVSIPSASPGSAIELGITSGGATAHVDTAKLEIYDFPGEYAQRFDGVDPLGNHVPSTVLGRSFSADAFEALVRVDLGPDAPEPQLYYTLRGRIAPDQPISFSNVTLIASPQGSFDLNLSFAAGGPVFDGLVIQLDLVGSTTPVPEPSVLAMAAIAALLAAARTSRYHSPRHG